MHQKKNLRINFAGSFMFNLLLRKRYLERFFPKTPRAIRREDVAATDAAAKETSPVEGSLDSFFFGFLGVSEGGVVGVGGM